MTKNGWWVSVPGAEGSELCTSGVIRVHYSVYIHIYFQAGKLQMKSRSPNNSSIDFQKLQPKM